MAFWLLRLEEWFLTSQPEAFVDVHHVRSLQFLESCVQSVWTETQLGRGRQGSATYELHYSSVTALEAALAALPDNADIFGKVRAPLEERLQHARKDAASLWIRDAKAAEEPSSEHPRQHK